MIDPLEIVIMESAAKCFRAAADRARQKLKDGTTVLEVRGRPVFVIDPDAAPLEWQIKFHDNLASQFERTAARARQDHERLKSTSTERKEP